MALAVLRDKNYPKTSLKTKNGSVSSIKNNTFSTDIPRAISFRSAINNNSSHLSEIRDKNSISYISQVLPFRVRFQNTKIGGYSPSNPAPIGIAVIGFNNYIL